MAPSADPAGATGQCAAPRWPCLSSGASGVRLAVSVVPNARRTGADGLHDGALRVRLAAPPVDGKANEMLLAWLAAELGLPRRSIRLVRGDSARRKTIEIDAAAEYVARWLGVCLGGAPDVK
ncbi:MAG: DUF167 domain-containing protein [Burkholderiaceae bacterium]|nr:DUF167 domain-containing protein [Burkholderiaceae bacterium]